jgi:hypothetical protein
VAPTAGLDWCGKFHSQRVWMHGPHSSQNNIPFIKNVIKMFFSRRQKSHTMLKYILPFDIADSFVFILGDSNRYMYKFFYFLCNL